MSYKHDFDEFDYDEYDDYDFCDYDLDRHKKSDKLKWIFTAIGFALAFILIIGCIVSSVKGTWNIAEWFTDDDITTEQTDNGDNNGANSFVVGNAVGNGVTLLSAVIPKSEYALCGVSPLAESAKTVTATVKDLANNEYENLVEFDLSWSSEEPIGDYLEMSVSGNTATISCIKAFDTQAILTVSLITDSEIKATTTIDYAARVEYIMVKESDSVYYDNGGRPYYYGALSMPDFNEVPGTSSTEWMQNAIFPYVSTHFNKGSITNLSNVSIAITATEELKDALTKENPYFYDLLKYTYTNNFDGTDTVGLSYYSLFMGIVGPSNISALGNSPYRINLYNAISSTTYDFNVEVTVTCASGTYEFSYALMVDATTSLSVSVDNSSIVF